MRSELDWIGRIKQKAKTRSAGVRVGIGDDCAVLKGGAGQEMVVTTDFCIEGRHFRRDLHSAESSGHRCLARGLSDVAAMGARPVAAFLSLALPRGVDEAWVDGFLAGLLGLAAQFGVELAGGDTTEAPEKEVLADVVLVGTTAKMRAMRRKGARVGDGIYVSGTLGAAAAELHAMGAGQPWEQEAQPQSHPLPRVELGLALAKRGWATACIDVSDGLSTDLRHLCEASEVRGVLDLDRLPIGEGATLEQALHGGDDYELLFTAMAGVRLPRQVAGVPITRIGTIVAGEGVGLLQGGELEASGWEHLRSF